MRYSASCRTTRASIGGPASSHASAPRPMTKRTRRSRASLALRPRPIPSSSEEHDGSHQQARLSLSARAAQRRSLDGDGAPLQRSALARSRHGRSRQVTPEGRVDEDDVDRLLAAYGERIAPISQSVAPPMSPASCNRFTDWRERRMPSAPPFSSMPHSSRHTVASTSSRTATRSISISWHSPATRCTRPSARVCWLAGATSSCEARRSIQGGGTVDIVTPDEVHWAGLPDREEAGSPNVVGAVATAAAARALMDTGMENVERHEAWLTTHALERLQSLSRYQPLWRDRSTSDARSRRGDRLQSRGDSSRTGRGHPQLRRGGSASAAAASARSRKSLISWRAKNPTRLSGTGRFGTGIGRADRASSASASRSYNTPDDIDALVEMLHRIARNDYKGTYNHVAPNGDCTPVGYEEVLPTRFSAANS